MLPPESLAAHRAQTLLATLPTALEHGVAETTPDREPLKVFSHLVLSHHPLLNRVL